MHGHVYTSFTSSLDVEHDGILPRKVRKISGISIVFLLDSRKATLDGLRLGYKNVIKLHLAYAPCSHRPSALQHSYREHIPSVS